MLANVSGLNLFWHLPILIVIISLVLYLLNMFISP